MCSNHIISILFYNMQNKINLKNFFTAVKKKKFNLESLNSYNNFLNLTTKKFLKKKNETCPVIFIITIRYTRVNTLLSVSNSKGVLRFFGSSGQFFSGRQKKSKISVIKKFLKLLLSNLNFLKKKPIALHLNNVTFNKFWIIRRLRKKLFIKTIKICNVFPHNGCRKKKKKRKKVRSYAKKKNFRRKNSKFKLKKLTKRWLSGLKRQIVNLLRILVAGSNPALFKF